MSAKHLSGRVSAQGEATGRRPVDADGTRRDVRSEMSVSARAEVRVGPDSGLSMGVGARRPGFRNSVLRAHA